jgi:alkylation response protein AidB-like acyl-CoA dehydrogenase
MDLNIGADNSEFRDEVRTWLTEHLVGEFRDHRGVGGPTDDSAWDVRVAWERELSKGNWLGLTWPVEYGGRGVGLAEEIVFEYEYARAAAPARVNAQALDLLGPTLLAFGSDTQKRRFLPRILAVEEMWGQGFSEPGAGSDLASVRTRAVREGDVWHIEGQKVWTTFGDRADWLYVLCRTDPDPALRHRGLTLFLVPARQPGVDIRPIENITRSTEFSECFFNDAQTGDDMVVGGVGNGWRVVMTTLGLERGSALLPMQLSAEREVNELTDAARSSGAVDDPRIRHRLVDALIGVHIMRSTSVRVVSDLLTPRDGAAGRATAAAATVSKLFASIHHQRLGELAVEVFDAKSLFGTRGDDAANARKLFLLSRAETIYGGTSEIQRNIIAERVLGLPR